MRTSALARRIQSKIYSSENIARSTLSKFVPLDGGRLPVSDCRRALNMMCTDCVPVSHLRDLNAPCMHCHKYALLVCERPACHAVLAPSWFPVVDALRQTVHRLFASMVQGMPHLATTFLVQDDKAMATLLCAFDPTGQGTLTYPSFLTNILNAFVAHPRMNPARAGDNDVTLAPTKDHFLGTEAPENTMRHVFAPSHSKRSDTRVHAHAISLRPVLSSLARCRICPVAERGSSPAEQWVWKYDVRTSCLFFPCLVQSHMSGMMASGMSVSMTCVLRACEQWPRTNTGARNPPEGSTTAPESGLAA
jgi:hypothetical protein